MSPGINIIMGDNAQGKTNFMEAVYFCALGRPLRADNSRELIPHGGQKAWVQAVFCRHSEMTVDARVELHGGKYVKSLTVDRVPIKNTRDLFGKVPVVSFSPEDLRLIKAGPTERRRFMDIEICQLSPVYYHELREYYRTLRQRNHLLKALQKDKSQLDSLSIWDEQLAAHGVRVMKTRAAYIKKINLLAQDIHKSITQGAEELNVEYRPGITDPEAYIITLEKYQTRDIILGSTSAGVHRDDVYFMVRGVSARSFGSQGQQRTAALSVKLAEIALIKEQKKMPPILLLDDVFSELDAHRQRFLLAQIKDVQTLITCTGIESLPVGELGDYRMITMKNGKIM